MQRSESRILTTHVGALPRPDDLLALNAEATRAEESGRPHDEQARQARLRDAVAEVVRRQVEVGLDVVNDGEYGKAMRARLDYGAWLSYLYERLGGWGDPNAAEPPPSAAAGHPGDASASPGTAAGELRPRSLYERRDRQRFADFYRELEFPSELRGNTRLGAGWRRGITGPITYTGLAALQTDLANLRDALRAAPATEAFMTSVAPGSFAREQNHYYRSQREFLFAVADAMRVEYTAITDAGFVLQIDDPGIAENWDAMDPSVTVDQYRGYAALCIEALNRALDGIPEDRVRYHLCWGSWHGPHVTDLPLRDLVDLLLGVHAGAFVVEAGNVRHEHEWKVWREVKLPPGKILMPGVVSHATNVVEHPEVVADRIVRYAEVVGRENVVASTDCGLGGRIHPSLAWAKLEALVDGARLASERLWGK
jgi:5-methyltetrahydropteroyltriglutamate--homocysteine methyltransferase